MIVRQLGNVWNMVRQINPNELHTAAKQPVTLLLLGRADSPVDKLAAILRRDESPAAGDAASVVQTARLDASPHAGSSANLLLALDVKPSEIPGVGDSQSVVFVTTRPGQVIVAPDAEHVHLATVDADSVRALLAPAIVRQLDQQALAAARRLPVLRPAYADWLINATSRANAMYAFSTGVAEVVPALNIPLNVADMLVLTKNQLAMVYKLALAAGRPESPAAVIRELMGVIGAGFMWRQISRELVGLIPVVGLVPKVAVAYGGTYAVGEAAQSYLIEGAVPASDQLQRLYRQAAQRGRDLAESLIDRGRSARLSPDSNDTEIRSNP